MNTMKPAVSTLRMSPLVQRLTSHKNSIVAYSIIRTNTTSSVTSGTETCPMRGASTVSAKPFKDIPGPRGLTNLPFIGSHFLFKPFTKYTPTTFHKLLGDMVDRYGTIFRLRLGEPTTIFTDPQGLSILANNEGKYPFRPPLKITESYCRRNNQELDLSCVQGEDWYKQKQPMGKLLLRPENVNAYLPDMNEVSDEFVQLLSEGFLDSRSTETTFMFYVAELASTLMFNQRLGLLSSKDGERNKKMMETTIELFDIMYKSTLGFDPFLSLYKTKAYKRFEKGRYHQTKIISSMIKNALDNTVEDKRNGNFNSNKNNILYSLYKELGEEKATRMIEMLFIAAPDSSAANLQSGLHLMAIHPDKQEKLRQEVHKAIGFDGPVTKESLTKMPYLRACLTETYRCHMPTPYSAVRKLPVDIVLEGYKIPANTLVMYYPFVTCNDPNIFPEPEKFKPERWIREDGKQRDEHELCRWAIHPFGFGARICLGKRVFEQEFIISLAKIVQKLNIRMRTGDQDIDFEYRMFFKSVKEMKFTFTPVDRNIAKHRYEGNHTNLSETATIRDSVPAPLI